MHPVLFKIGPLSVFSWGFMVALGFATGIAVAALNAKKENLTVDQVMELSAYTILSALIGARLFYVIQYWDEFSGNIPKIFAVWEGGMVFYGGLILALVVLLTYCSFNKMSLLKVLDLAAPSAAIGYAIGRIGCFLKGCCFGNECSLPWAIRIPGVEGLHHPTQLYSSVAGIIIFLVLAFIRGRKKYDGQVFIWGGILYSVYRFILEFFRFSPMYLLGLTISQWMSIAFLIVLLPLLAALKLKNK